MSEHKHNLGHTVHTGHTAAKIVEEMPRLPNKKNPVVAGVVGLFFGALGIGLYFQSWKDFFVCMFLFIGLLILIPGFGALPGWLFAPVYGIYRAYTSNEKHH